MFLPVSLAFFAGGTCLQLLANRGRRPRRGGLAICCFMAFQTYLYLRNVSEGNKSGFAIGKMIGLYVLVLMIVIWAASGHTLKESVRNLLRPFAWCGLIMTACMAIQAAVDFSPLIWDGEVMGFSGHPQALGITCGCLFGASLALLKLESSRFYWWSALMASVIMPLMIVASGSRTAMLATVIAIMSLWTVQNRMRAVCMGVIGIALAPVALLAIQSFQGRFSFAAMANREGAWTDLWSAFMREPILGTGILPATSVSGASSVTENGYLVALAMGGAVALIFLMAVILIILVRILPVFRFAPSGPVNSSVKQFLVYAFVYIAVASFFEGFMIGFVQSYSIGILFGITSIYIADISACQARIPKRVQRAGAKPSMPMQREFTP